MHDRRPRPLAASRSVIASSVAATLVALPLLASPLAGQAGLAQLEDAATPPGGFLRFRPIIAWTRYDARFTPTGTEPLGAPFTAESLGSARYQRLAAIEMATRQVAQAGPAYRLNLGRASMNATARVEVLPLAFDYGVTDRLAVGVVIPIVRKRIATLFQLDSAGANVGPNLQRTSATASQANELVQTEFADAASQLQSSLTACQGSPSAPGCPTILADAPALLAESQTFAAAVASLYGSSSDSGAAFVPRSQSAEQMSVALRVSDFNARYRALLGSDVIQAVPVGAAGPPGTAEFQSFVVDEVRGDSLNTQERLTIGDIEIGLKFRVVDRPATDQRRLGLQLALAAGARMPTGSRQTASEVADLSSSEGDPILDVRGVLDARLGRAGLLSAVHASSRLGGDAAISGAPAGQRNATWLELHLAPRWHLSDVFAVHGAYSFRKTDLNRDQLLGGGVSFSTFASRRPAGRRPMEMRFTHLEATSGDPGRPKFFREQLEVRIYYRVR